MVLGRQKSRDSCFVKTGGPGLRWLKQGTREGRGASRLWERPGKGRDSCFVIRENLKPGGRGGRGSQGTSGGRGGRASGGLGEKAVDRGRENRWGGLGVAQLLDVDAVRLAKAVSLIS